MHKSLKKILEIQERDMQMIQLMRLKQERQRELDNINAVKKELEEQATFKENEIIELKKNIRMMEGELAEIAAKFKKLEGQQNNVKKVEEFNALSHEMSTVDREKSVKEGRIHDLQEKLNAENEILKNLKSTLDSTIESSKILELEIFESIGKINEEGSLIKVERDRLVAEADKEVFGIYERLLRNKKDRVVVPIENRCCSGCHIMLTAQDENMVRKGERLIFCEHCSRIHYWPESESLEGTPVVAKTRRRRSTKV
ncbi:MAG TPA: C4-type zinc ribbon domain-containing protein [Parachlamydiaceae bacterium]|nr:C4-type zinc ribbon domain-containing protein [Parachlamydiaceae bacterium]